MAIKKIFLPAALLLLCALLPSCERNLSPQEAYAGGDFCEVSLTLDGGFFGHGTRSHWVSDELADSGYQLIVYNRTYSMVERVLVSASRDAGLRLPLRRGDEYMLLVLGNYWLIDRADGSRHSVEDGLGGVDLSLSELFDPAGPFAVRIFPDEVDVAGNASLRHETFDELKSLGIPYSGFCEICTDGTPESMQVRIDNLRYLFARISVCIDHSGLDGGIDTDYFENSSLCLRNVPTQVQTFLDGDISAFMPGADQIAHSGDYENFSTNGSMDSYFFYLPENNQGSVSSLTSATRVPGNAPEHASYVEFTGWINPDAGGYGGTVRYRFYPGLNNSDNFQIPRGSDIRIRLSFKASSVYGSRLEACWKVETDSDFVDRRIVAIDTVGDGNPSDFVGSAECPSSVIALRKSSSRSLRLFYSRSGSGGNEILMPDIIRAWSESFDPSSVQVSALRVLPDKDHGEACDYSRHGISASIDMASGRLLLSVTDPALFETGREYDMFLELYPGRLRFPFRIRTCEDISVSFDPSDFYVGMKRPVSVSGFCGNPAVSVKELAAVSVLKTSPSAGDADYVTQAPVPVSGGLNVYAYRACSSVTLRIGSDDVFNDGDTMTEKKFTVYSPALVLPKDSYFVPIDGTEVPLGLEYRTSLTSGSALPESSFDPDVYAQLLKPEILLAGWTLCVGVGDNSVYCSELHSSKSTSEFALGKVYARAREQSLNIVSASREVRTAFPRWKNAADFTGVRTDYYDFFSTPSDASSIPLPSLRSDPVEIYLQGCGAASIRPTAGQDNVSLYSKAVCEVEVDGSRGASRVRWCFAPDNLSADILYAPYGRQTVEASFTNVHSHETFTLEPKYCTVTHNVDLKILLTARTGQKEGVIHFGTGLSHYLTWLKEKFGLSLPGINIGYGIVPQYSYCIPKSTNGEYPLLPGGARELMSGEKAYVLAGYFAYGGQLGTEWGLWENETFSESVCSGIVQDWNHGTSDEYYGGPEPTWFYKDASNVSESLLPLKYYPDTDRYPGLSSYFILSTGGHPPYSGYYCRP